MGTWVFFGSDRKLEKKKHAHKIPRFRAGVLGFLERGCGSTDFIFMGAGPQRLVSKTPKNSHFENHPWACSTGRYSNTNMLANRVSGLTPSRTFPECANGDSALAVRNEYHPF